MLSPPDDFKLPVVVGGGKVKLPLVENGLATVGVGPGSALGGMSTVRNLTIVRGQRWSWKGIGLAVARRVRVNINFGNWDWGIKHGR